MEIRKIYNAMMRQIMAEDPRIVVIDADLGASCGTKDLRKDFPDRAFDVGVAEANMCSLAAGLSSYGFIPFIHTFTPFATRRMFDQITLSVCYAKQNVKIVGADPGICAEVNGGTHMSLEDMALMRTLPDMVVFEPVDAEQFKQALPQIIAHPGPVYIRMFRKELETVFDENYKFDLFTADVIKEGRDLTILASGIMVQECMKALPLLEENGISAEVINVHTLKPFDEKTVIESAKKTGAVLTCENHSLVGGLYSATAEVLAREYPVKMAGIGVADRFGEVGKTPYLKKVMGMTAEDILAKAKTLLGK